MTGTGKVVKLRRSGASIKRDPRCKDVAKGWNSSRLRLARTAMSLTLEDVSVMTGISRSVIHNMEITGGRGPNAQELASLCRAFKVKPDFFLGPTVTIQMLREILERD